MTKVHWMGKYVSNKQSYSEKIQLSYFVVKYVKSFYMTLFLGNSEEIPVLHLLYRVHFTEFINLKVTGEFLKRVYSIPFFRRLMCFENEMSLAD